jgi:hypothetical protein
MALKALTPGTAGGFEYIRKTAPGTVIPRAVILFCLHRSLNDSL